MDDNGGRPERQAFVQLGDVERLAIGAERPDRFAVHLDENGWGRRELFGSGSSTGHKNMTSPPSIILACTKRALMSQVLSVGPGAGPGGNTGGRSCAANEPRNVPATTTTNNRRF